MYKKQISFISLFSFIIFCLYIFINFLFPYASIVSVSFLAISVGISSYCIFTPNQTLLIISLISVLLSIAFALGHYYTLSAFIFC